MMARKGVAALLIALFAMPAWASPPPTCKSDAIRIGAVSSSEEARIGGAGAIAGTTIFSGDVVEVGPRGWAWVLLKGGTPVRIAADSRVRMVQSAVKPPLATSSFIELEVLNGAVTFRTSVALPVTAHLGDALVRARGAQPAVATVAVRNNKRAVILAEKGELLVSTAHDAKSITLREGEAVEVTLVPSPAAPGTADNLPCLTGMQLAILGGTVALIISLIGWRVSSDNKGLTDQQKRNMVSPFVFP